MDGTRGQLYGMKSEQERGYAWLFYVLSTIRSTKCSEEYPHDQVFAALNVGKRLLPEDTDRRLIPDYNLGVAELYTRVATAIIESTNSLFLLGHVGTPRLPSLPNLPSWVPYFNQDAGVDAIELGMVRKYNASKTGNIRDGTFLISADTLWQRSYELDQVHNTCELTTQEWQDTNKVHVMINFATQKQIGGMSQSLGSAIETLWRSMLEDTYEEKQPAPQHIEKFLYSYVSMFLTGYKAKVGTSDIALGVGGCMKRLVRKFLSLSLKMMPTHTAPGVCSKQPSKVFSKQ